MASSGHPSRARNREALSNHRGYQSGLRQLPRSTATHSGGKTTTQEAQRVSTAAGVAVVGGGGQVHGMACRC